MSPARRLALLVPFIVQGCIEYEPKAKERHDTVPQPPPPEVTIQIDRIVQITEPAVDVLFVVDNSCSMTEEQAALAENFPVFLDFFQGSGLDWHIGVVSTDMTDPDHSGKLRRVAGVRYLDRDTPNPEQVFTQMAVMGISGDSEEKGRAAAYTAIELRRDGARNEGFYRDEASLHFVFISDEDDQSGANPVTRQEFRQWMETLKWAPDLVTSHAITWVPGTPCSAADEVGGTYASYADWTGGILFDLCAPDWAPFMDELGLQTSGLKREFFLSRLPVLDSLDVKVESEQDDPALPDVVVGYEVCIGAGDCPVVYNPGRNSVSFVNEPPAAQSTVRITYTIREDFQAGVVETEDVFGDDEE